MQREIQSRCNTRAAQHGPILYENAVVQNARRRIYPAQLLNIKQRVLTSDVGALSPIVARMRRSDDPAKLVAQLARLNA